MLYLACVLHDLGLTSRFEGDLPFEIQGAEAAQQFLSDHDVPREKVEVIWDGIALHASAVSGFKQPEVALVGEGAGADVLGADPAEIPRDKVEEVLKAFPRLLTVQELVSWDLCGRGPTASSWRRAQFYARYRRALRAGFPPQEFL